MFDVQFLSRLPPPRSKFGVRRSMFDVQFLSHLPPPRSKFGVRRSMFGVRRSIFSF